MYLTIKGMYKYFKDIQIKNKINADKVKNYTNQGIESGTTACYSVALPLSHSLRHLGQFAQK